MSPRTPMRHVVFFARDALSSAMPLKKRLIAKEASEPVTSSAPVASPSAAKRTKLPVTRTRDPAWPDRKSTRLNSSHRCISYAVFCLKKKKKKYKNEAYMNAQARAKAPKARI